MHKLIAIGGGEIGRPGYHVETTKIDKEIIRLSGKQKPRLLFIPTASSDAQGYIQTVQNHFGKRLNCKVDTLLLIKSKPSLKLIKHKIMNTDIIYVGGGDTGTMIKVWQSYGVDKILKAAYDQGIILSGLSAGAICWFKYGLSDSQRFKNQAQPFSYIRIKGLGFFSFTVSPHHIREKARKAALIKIMKTTPGIGLALDDFTALEIINDKYRIIISKPGAKVHKVFYKDTKLSYKPLKQQKEYLPLSNLEAKD